MTTKPEPFAAVKRLIDAQQPKAPVASTPDASALAQKIIAAGAKARGGEPEAPTDPIARAIVEAGIKRRGGA